MTTNLAMHTHTHLASPLALPGPLKWSLKRESQIKGSEIVAAVTYRRRETYIQIHNADGDAGAAARSDYRINFSLIVVAISC